MKPHVTLSNLEREPIVYFGCTWSEILSSVGKAFLYALGVLIVLIMIPVSYNRMFAVLPMIITWIVSAGLIMRKIRQLRSGKPLFYEKHLKMVKRKNLFINPSQLTQIERNTHGT